MKMNEKAIVCWKTPSFIFGGLVSILLFGSAAFAQTSGTPPVKVQTPLAKTRASVLHPRTTEYRSIKIGTTADDVREKLGKAEILDKDGFYYRFSNDEFAQIRVDPRDKVRLIAVTYSGEKAPKFTNVFGDEIKIGAEPDGSIYKLVGYPDAGYWVTYSRSAGEKPTITLTMQGLAP